MEASELDSGEFPAVKALGSLFTLTKVFLWDDCSAATSESRPDSLHMSVSDSIVENTDDTELSRQLSALGLPVSFRTSKVRSGLVKCKRKDMNQKHSHGHEGNEGVIDPTNHDIAAETEKVGHVSGEEEYSENLTYAVTCAAVEGLDCEVFPRVTSDYSLNSDAALCSESLEVLDHDDPDSKLIGGSEVWASYWDSFYSRYYFYNTRTNESTWDPPPGMEHLAFGEVIDKPEEAIGDIIENLGSRCSIDTSGETKRDDQSLDQILREPCLSFELAGENFHSPISISELNYSFENLNEAQEIRKTFFEEDSFNLLQECKDRSEIEKLEKGIINVLQSPINGAIHEEIEDYRVVIKKKKKARKRTWMSRKLSIVSGELHFQGILEDCIAEEKGMLEELSPSISKYWCQRYLLFSKYDHGIKMDEEGWFSATPELIAKHHAIRCGDGIIVDCFGGVGGNAIQFARRSKNVIAIDINPKKVEYAQHNAAIYGVSDHIDFIVGDFFILAPKLKADCVFLSPPWGGPGYSKATTYDINTMLKPQGGQVLFNAAKGIASKIVMFLPKTVDLNQLAELSLSVDPPWSLEVEMNFLNGKLKALTAYFTDVSL